MSFKGIPSFPEHFRYINNADPMKAKQARQRSRSINGRGELPAVYFRNEQKNNWNCRSV
jgi:peptide subunit release factor RF-3